MKVQVSAVAASPAFVREEASAETLNGHNESYRSSAVIDGSLKHSNNPSDCSESSAGERESMQEESPPIWQQAIAVLIGTIVSAIVYQLFMLAVLWQSIVQGWPVDTDAWQEQLPVSAWLVGLAIFVVLMTSPTLLLVLNVQPGATQVDNATGESMRTPVVEGDWIVGLYAFILALLLVQVATIYYAYLRKDLGAVVRQDTRFRYGSCPIWMCPCRCLQGYWRRDGMFPEVGIASGIPPGIIHSSTSSIHGDDFDGDGGGNSQDNPSGRQQSKHASQRSPPSQMQQANGRMRELHALANDRDMDTDRDRETGKSSFRADRRSEAGHYVGGFGSAAMHSNASIASGDTGVIPHLISTMGFPGLGLIARGSRKGRGSGVGSTRQTPGREAWRRRHKPEPAFLGGTKDGHDGHRSRGASSVRDIDMQAAQRRTSMVATHQHHQQQPSGGRSRAHQRGRAPGHATGYPKVRAPHMRAPESSLARAAVLATADDAVPQGIELVSSGRIPTLEDVADDDAWDAEDTTSLEKGSSNRIGIRGGVLQSRFHESDSGIRNQLNCNESHGLQLNHRRQLDDDQPDVRNQDSHLSQAPIKADESRGSKVPDDVHSIGVPSIKPPVSLGIKTPQARPRHLLFDSGPGIPPGFIPTPVVYSPRVDSPVLVSAGVHTPVVVGQHMHGDGASATPFHAQGLTLPPRHNEVTQLQYQRRQRSTSAGNAASCSGALAGLSAAGMEGGLIPEGVSHNDGAGSFERRRAVSSNPSNDMVPTAQQSHGDIGRAGVESQQGVGSQQTHDAVPPGQPLAGSEKGAAAGRRSARVLPLGDLTNTAVPSPQGADVCPASVVASDSQNPAASVPAFDRPMKFFRDSVENGLPPLSWCPQLGIGRRCMQAGCHSLAYVCIDASVEVQYGDPRCAEVITFDPPTETPPRWVELQYTDGQVPALVCPCSLSLWRNWLFVGIAGFEVLQLVSMGLNSAPALSIKLLQVAPADLIAFMEGAADWFFSLGASVSGESVSDTEFPFIFCAVFSGMYVILSGLFIALDLGLDSFVAPLLFSLFAGGLYVTVTSTLLFVISATTRRDEAIACALCLVYYSSTAVFMSIYRGDGGASGSLAGSQVSTVPLFLAVERVLKGALASSFVLIEDDTIRASAVVGFVLVYVAAFAWFMPISVPTMTVLRVGGMVLGLWAGILSLVATVSGSTSGALLGHLLLGGWLIIATLVATAIGCSCGHRTFACIYVRFVHNPKRLGRGDQQQGELADGAV